MLKLHFLNVGHGDCCLIEFIDNSRLAIIDINRTGEMDAESIKEICKSASLDSSQMLLYEANLISAESLLEKAGYDIELQDPISYLTDMRNVSMKMRHPHQ